MMTIEPATGWSEIVEFPLFDPNEVSSWNKEYMDKYSSRVIQTFDQIYIQIPM